MADHEFTHTNPDVDVHAMGEMHEHPTWREYKWVALVLTVINWGAQVASYHLTAVAAHFPITVGGSITELLAVNVGFLVRATPGNVGVFQALYALTAQALGLSKDAAVGVALLLQTVQNVPVTALGAVLAPDLVLGARGRAAARQGLGKLPE